MTESDAKVVAIDPSRVALPQQPVGAVVTALRDLLEAAERGEIQGFCYASIDPGSWIRTNWHFNGRSNGLALVGGVARLLYRMNVAQD